MQAAEDLPFIADCSPAPSTHTKERLAIRGELMNTAGGQQIPLGAGGTLGVGVGSARLLRPSGLSKWKNGILGAVLWGS